MDVIYPLGHGSIWKDRELWYSLLSLDKFVSGIDRVYILGPIPRWSAGVSPKLKFQIINVPSADLHSCKEKNIMTKVMHACSIPDISQQFLFVNDDHFAIRPVVADQIPCYFEGTLTDYAARRLPITGKDAYQEVLTRTIEALKGQGYADLHCDVHVPIIYDKTEFVRAMQKYDWSGKRGYVIKSLYANSTTAHKDFSPIRDCKIEVPHTAEQIDAQVRDRDFISVGDQGLNDPMKEYLSSLFGPIG
jgi:hypothetical protein